MFPLPASIHWRRLVTCWAHIRLCISSLTGDLWRRRHVSRALQSKIGDADETTTTSYKLRYEQKTEIFTSLESLDKTLSSLFQGRNISFSKASICFAIKAAPLIYVYLLRRVLLASG